MADKRSESGDDGKKLRTFRLTERHVRGLQSIAATFGLADQTKALEWMIEQFSILPRGVSPDEADEAVGCWLHLLEGGANDISDKFTSAELVALSDRLGTIKADPVLKRPGELLADASKDRRLEKLTYVQAWTLLLACRFYRKHKDKIGSNDEWWKPEFWRMGA